MWFSKEKNAETVSPNVISYTKAFSKSKALLHVEDCESQRLYFREKFKYLKLKNVVLLQAVDVMSALNIIAKEDISFAVIDKNLPGFSGEALISVLKSKNIPVVFFTAYEAYEFKTDCPVFTKCKNEDALFIEIKKKLG